MYVTSATASLDCYGQPSLTFAHFVPVDLLLATTVDTTASYVATSVSYNDCVF